MTLDDIDEVTALRNYRRRAIHLRGLAQSSPIECSFAAGDAKIDPFSVISSMPVREAIMSACTAEIAEYDKRLGELGVEIPQESQP